MSAYAWVFAFLALKEGIIVQGDVEDKEIVFCVL